MKAIITIREMLPSKKEGTIKFKDNSNKTWNCNKADLIPHFEVGERYTIDFNESQFQGSNGPVTMKWVNKAKFWSEEDGDHTWPDKEPYTPGYSQYGSPSKGGSKMSKDYDPEIGKRQTAANCAMSWCVANTKTADELGLLFPAIADIVLKWVDTKGSVDSLPNPREPKVVAGDEDIPFGEV